MAYLPTFPPPSPVYDRRNEVEYRRIVETAFRSALVPGPESGYRELGRTTVNMNTTADQAIALASEDYYVKEIVVTQSAVNLTTAAGGIYTAASKGGTAVVAAAQVYSALTGTTTQVLGPTIASPGRFTANPIFFSLTTPQGSAATADVYLYGHAFD